MFFGLKMPNYVPIRPAVHIHNQPNQNLPLYGTIFAKPHEKSQGKNFTSLFLTLNGSKKKFLWHTFLYGPKKLQEGFALFFLSFLSFKKEVNVHLRGHGLKSWTQFCHF